VKIAPVPRAAVEPMSASLFALGSSGVQEEPVAAERRPPRQPWDDGPEAPEARNTVLTAWFEGADEAAVEAEITAISRRFRVTPTVRWSDVVDVDWDAQARASFKPIRISERLTVAPPWDAPPGALVIEPGQGFGTGDHPTTRAALVALDALVGQDVRTVLDVGCGSGILALAAASLGARSIGIDVEAAAVAEARRDAAVNRLSDRAHFSTDPLESLVEPADLVVANLHAELIERLAPHLLRLSRRWLVLAGILADREAKVLGAIGLAPDRREVDGEWVCLWMRR
jgi:ribosomal protein L11 methyltransferase